MAGDDEVIDATNDRQIGMLVGMSGGTITDAEMARFVLERFEKINGRKATMREIGMVIGMLKREFN